jgi:hypothetical protein
VLQEPLVLLEPRLVLEQHLELLLGRLVLLR